MDGDSADSSGAINQVLFVFSQGIEGLGAPRTAAICVGFNGRAIFTRWS